MKSTFDLIVEKMKKYCAIRDRSHTEVRTKLLKDKIYGDELEEVMTVLIQEDFLNEERYANAYVIGKFNQNRWGKIKIIHGLKRQNISDYCIRKAIAQIEEEKYIKTIYYLRIKKEKLIHTSNDFEKKQKIIRYLLGKGYEIDMIEKSYNTKAIMD
jgi:regulatory protein